MYLSPLVIFLILMWFSLAQCECEEDRKNRNIDREWREKRKEEKYLDRAEKDIQRRNAARKRRVEAAEALKLRERINASIGRKGP